MKSCEIPSFVAPRHKALCETAEELERQQSLSESLTWSRLSVGFCTWGWVKTKKWLPYDWGTNIQLFTIPAMTPGVPSGFWWILTHSPFLAWMWWHRIVATKMVRETQNIAANLKYFGSKPKATKTRSCMCLPLGNWIMTTVIQCKKLGIVTYIYIYIYIYISVVICITADIVHPCLSHLWTGS